MDSLTNVTLTGSGGIGPCGGGFQHSGCNTLWCFNIVVDCDCVSTGQSSRRRGVARPSRAARRAAGPAEGEGGAGGRRAGVDGRSARARSLRVQFARVSMVIHYSGLDTVKRAFIHSCVTRGKEPSRVHHQKLTEKLTSRDSIMCHHPGGMYKHSPSASTKSTYEAPAKRGNTA